MSYSLKYYLVNHYVIHLKLSKEWFFFLLCPLKAHKLSSIYQLDKRELDYITFEDYYTSGEIRGDTEKYLMEAGFKLKHKYHSELIEKSEKFSTFFNQIWTK